MSAFSDAVVFVNRFQKEAPVDVVGLAGVLGIRVWESHQLPEGIAGKLKLDAENGGESGFSMIVRAQDPLVRKRFTVAHEIAHYLLHKTKFKGELVDDALYRSTLSSRLESEANAMAAEILMPKHLIDQYSDRSTSEIAELFQVSMGAMTIRLESMRQPYRALA
jgi:uncharacterized protein DUF955